MGLDRLSYNRQMGESKDQYKERQKVLKKLRDELKADGFILKDSHTHLDVHLWCEYQNDTWNIQFRRDAGAMMVNDGNFEWRTDYPRLYVYELDDYFDPNDKNMREKYYFGLLKCLQVHKKFYLLLQQICGNSSVG